MQGLFVTGTDTDVGKTFVAASIVRTCRDAGLRVGAYKPVCSGSRIGADGQACWPDVTALAAAIGGDVSPERICPQCFHAPLAPPAAAALENRTVDDALLRGGIDTWRESAELLIVEGVGGLLCPLSETLSVADLAGRFGFPLVIVAALRLGAINQTLLTLEVAQSRRLPIAGILLNQMGADDGSNDSSIAEITDRSDVPVLGVLPWETGGRLRPPEVIRKIDWQRFAAAAALD